MNNLSVLRRYWFSKMTCGIHGKYVARTSEKPTGAVACPECTAAWALDDQCRGTGKGDVPFVSKPRIPQNTKIEFTHSPKAALRKRSRAS